MTWIATYGESTVHFYRGLGSVCTQSSISGEQSYHTATARKVFCSVCKRVLASTKKTQTSRKARLQLAQTEAKKKFRIGLEQMLMNRLSNGEEPISVLRKLFATEFKGVHVEDLIQKLVIQKRITIQNDRCIPVRRATHVT